MRQTVGAAGCFLTGKKGEGLYAAGALGKGGIHLEKTARCISHGVENELPYLISDRGYGILSASSKEVIFCSLPVYGKPDLSGRYAAAGLLYYCREKIRDAVEGLRISVRKAVRKSVSEEWRSYEHTGYCWTCDGRTIQLSHGGGGADRSDGGKAFWENGS